MTPEEALGEIFNFITTWGPWALAIWAVFALIVLSLVIYVFVRVFKGMRRFDRHFDRFDRRR